MSEIEEIKKYNKLQDDYEEFKNSLLPKVQILLDELSMVHFTNPTMTCWYDRIYNVKLEKLYLSDIDLSVKDNLIELSWEEEDNYGDTRFGSVKFSEALFRDTEKYIVERIPLEIKHVEKLKEEARIRKLEEVKRKEEKLKTELQELQKSDTSQGN